MNKERHTEGDLQGEPESGPGAPRPAEEESPVKGISIVGQGRLARVALFVAALAAAPVGAIASAELSGQSPEDWIKPWLAPATLVALSSLLSETIEALERHSRTVNK